MPFLRKREPREPKKAKPRSLGRDAMRRLMKNRAAVAGGVILLVLFFERRISGGLTGGAVKG